MVDGQYAGNSSSKFLCDLLEPGRPEPVIRNNCVKIGAVMFRVSLRNHVDIIAPSDAGGHLAPRNVLLLPRAVGLAAEACVRHHVGSGLERWGSETVLIGRQAGHAPSRSLRAAPVGGAVMYPARVDQPRSGR